MARNGLEERLEGITRAFVAQIVAAIRSASFAEVAELDVTAARGAREVSPSAARATRVTASPKRDSSATPQARQTADRRAELADRLIKALEGREPMSARALSGELGVAVDLLAVPLRELRASGRIEKHGEKRATTYSVA